jgi:hypothetical protein
LSPDNNSPIPKLKSNSAGSNSNVSAIIL